MALIVQKYGGTSVGDTEKIKIIADRVIKRKDKGDDIIVVVSAMGKTTDHLVKLASEVSDDPCDRELDMLLSTGEQITIALLSMAFKARGYDSISFTGIQAGIKTTGNHTKNKITDIESENIKRELDAGKIVVVAGFQGVNEHGDITTLGRGGSDTTAVALAAKFGATCEVYTDVDGIYTVDPRVCKNAKKLDFISYEEMMEMASRGASVMETRAVEIACKFGVPIYVASSMTDEVGTIIKRSDEHMEEKMITGISVADDVVMVTINNVKYNLKNIARIFTKLADMNINVDMISQTGPIDGLINISFTAPTDDVRKINKIIDELRHDMKNIVCYIETNVTKISVVGIGMMTHSGVAAKVFEVFAERDINFKQVTTSEISISYTIEEDDKEAAVEALAEKFNLTNTGDDEI